MLETLQSRGQGDMRPLITVGMPIYNAGEYLRLAVLSIVKQTFTDWELLIIDDGSTDNALEHIADIKDERIHVLRDGHNKGLAARLNECIDLSRGKYFARMDQDDVSYLQRFARQIEALQKDSTLDLVAARAITIDENDMATGMFPYSLLHDEICARPWMGFYFPHPTWLGKIEWFRRYRYMVPGPYFCEDQELLLRAYRTSQFATVNEVLFAYRIRLKINWHKLLKTRMTLLHIQLDQFIESRQWGCMMMALITAMARLFRDSAQIFYRQRPQTIPSHVLRKWQEVLNTISGRQNVLPGNTDARSER